MRPPIVLLLFIVAAFASYPPPPAFAERQPAAVIVLDGSGSMWGQLGDGQASEQTKKFYLVRDALKQAIGKAGPATRLAVLSFGHRRKAACDDVELIAPLDTAAAGRVASGIDRISPRGKGPLALALKEAAKVAAQGAPASVILVHDGDDNCQQDVCLAASEIAKSHPGMPIHTIGIGLTPVDARKMACIAKTTGGRVFDAGDPAGLARSVEKAFELAALMTPAEPAAGAPEPQPVPSGLAASAGPSRIRLTAHLGSVEEPITAPVDWVLRETAGERKIVLESTSPEILAPLAPGGYEVEARLSRVSTRAEVTVAEKGLTAARITFDAGVIDVTARQSREVAEARDIVLAIAPADGGEGVRWIGRGGMAEVVLPRGRYRVTAAHGLARQERDVTVAAGAVAAADIVMDSGRLELAAVEAEQAPVLEGLTWSIAVDDPAAPQGRREVARSAAPGPSFVLPTGTYYITARFGTGETRERVAVEAGATVRKTLVLGFARLSLAALAGAVPVSSETPVLFRVTRLDEGAREVARGTGPAPEFALAAGRYTIEVQLGPWNARATQDVELKPGERSQVSVDVNAGEFVLRLAEGARAPVETFWEIKDEGNNVVWRTTRGESRGFLAPGRYVATFEGRDKKAEQSFELAAGESKTIEIRLE